MKLYTVVLTPEPDGSAYNVTVPSLAGSFTWGATLEEALTNARDAIAVYLADEDGAEDFTVPPGEVIVATIRV